jgi:hypothetical protein
MPILDFALPVNYCLVVSRFIVIPRVIGRSGYVCGTSGSVPGPVTVQTCNTSACAMPTPRLHGQRTTG